MKASQSFDKDGIHFTEEAGKNFIKTILYFAGEFFDATLVEFDEATDMEITMEPEKVKVVVTDESGPIASGSAVAPAIEDQLAEI